mgnify:CR=1 FL=1
MNRRNDSLVVILNVTDNNVLVLDYWWQLCHNSASTNNNSMICFLFNYNNLYYNINIKYSIETIVASSYALCVIMTILYIRLRCISLLWIGLTLSPICWVGLFWESVEIRGYCCNECGIGTAKVYLYKCLN